MTIEWDQLRELVVEGNAPKIADAVCELTDAERKALAAPLKEFDRRARRWEDHVLAPNHSGAMTLAASGIISSPSELAPWFRRYGVHCTVGPPWVRHPMDDLLLGVLRARRVPWLGDLAHRLAEFRAGYPDIVLGLAAIAGIDPPTHDHMVENWSRREGLVKPGELDPAWDALLLRIFEVDGVGRTLQFREGTGLGLAVTTFVAEGRLDRTEVIDLCLGALQRGGSLGDVRGYLAVHTALELDLPEVVGRLRDYLPLLADGHSTAAGMAQGELFRADEAGELTIEMFLEASRSVFARTEKKLVRAQLDRLRLVLKRTPGAVDDLLRVLTAVFGHEAVDLRKRAVDLAAAFAPAASAETRGELAAAAAGLPSDLGARAAEAFGSTPAAEPVVPAPALPAAVGREMVSPVGSPEELAEEVAVLRAGLGRRNDASVDPVRLERVLDGLVTWSYRDRAALGAALGAAESEEIAWDRWLSHYFSEGSELEFVIHVAGTPAVAEPNAPYPDPETFTGERGWQQKLTHSYGHRPYTRTVQPGMLLARLIEIAVGMMHAPRPFLLAAPTSTTGLLDPEVLLGRLTAAAAEGWEPWRRDFTQALLRLPADSDASIAPRARALGTAAGDRLAHWLATDADERVELSLPQVLGEFDQFTQTLSHTFMTCWSPMLPSHRDTVARYLVPTFRYLTAAQRGGGSLLLTLAGSDGPVRDATLDALAYGTNAKDQNDRAGAVDALLVLAGRGDLDGAAFGRRIGSLTAAGEVVLGRTVPCLRDLARSGAAAHTWEAVAAALPELLTAERPPSGLADLLALGVELADELHPASTVPHLADVAARRGSSRVVTEAKRLAASLG